MAMSASSLKQRIINYVNANIRPKYINPPDDQNLTGYTFDDYWDDVSQAIAEAVIDEIHSNARCSGIDSHGDSHDNVGIV